MRIYTLDRWGINPFVKVETCFLPDGRSFPAFTLGEEGRGRKLVFVPVTLTPASRQKWERDGWASVENVSVFVNRKGFIHLKEEEGTSEDNEYLIVFRAWIGFRGHNSITYYEGGALGKDVILAEGTIAEGAAGRMGWGGQWLMKVRQGDVYRFQVTGRLYGEPGSFIIACTTNGPLVYFRGGLGCTRRL